MVNFTQHPQVDVADSEEFRARLLAFTPEQFAAFYADLSAVLDYADVLQTEKRVDRLVAAGLLCSAPWCTEEQAEAHQKACAKVAQALKEGRPAETGVWPIVRRFSESETSPAAYRIVRLAAGDLDNSYGHVYNPTHHPEGV